MLTVSTHSPFKIPDQARYDAMAEQRIRSLRLTAEEQAAHLQYKAVYASILYMDESLRGFFQQLQQRPDYANTIVLVTGDHRLPEIPMRSKLDAVSYPVAGAFAADTAFRKILLPFPLTLMWHLLSPPCCRRSTALPPPPYVTWVGSGLDTARAFRNVHQYPLMRAKSDLSDYVAGAYLLNGGSLFKILPNMDLEPDSDGRHSRRAGCRFRALPEKRPTQLVQTKPAVACFAVQAICELVIRTGA